MPNFMLYLLYFQFFEFKQKFRKYIGNRVFCENFKVFVQISKNQNINSQSITFCTTLFFIFSIQQGLKKILGQICLNMFFKCNASTPRKSLPYPDTRDTLYVAAFVPIIGMWEVFGDQFAGRDHFVKVFAHHNLHILIIGKVEIGPNSIVLGFLLKNK